MQCNKAIRIIARKIQKQGYNVKISYKSLKNLVGSVNYGSKIDLSEFSKLIGFQASFVPELFPGLIVTTEKCKVTVFRSGKINITGGKTIEEINSAYNVIYNYLFELYLKLL
jgi:TATA-box binding protein (TBP) (component of TFIID and TFIIIB)